MTAHPDPSDARTIQDIVDELASAGDPLETLRCLVELHDWQETAQTLAVGLARAQGRTFLEIAGVLGVSQQAVSKRYGCVRKDDETSAAEPREKAKAQKPVAAAPRAFRHFDRNGELAGYMVAAELDELINDRADRDDRADRAPRPVRLLRAAD